MNRLFLRRQPNTRWTIDDGAPVSMLLLTFRHDTPNPSGFFQKG
jgi:hypothetical protein